MRINSLKHTWIRQADLGVSQICTNDPNFTTHFNFAQLPYVKTFVGIELRHFKMHFKFVANINCELKFPGPYRRCN